MMRASDSFQGNEQSLPGKPRAGCGRGMRRGRWAALACGLVAAAHALSGEPAQQVFDFDVNLDKRPIGTHRFTVTREPGGITRIQSVARFDVRVLGFTAYRYRHQATEQWKGDCLASLDASTDDNGRHLRVGGARRESGFQLQQPAATALPACVSAYAYWNRDLLLRQSALLNPQTGKLDPLRVEKLGGETIDVRGRPAPAERIRLHAAQNLIDLWYSPGGEWLRLESTTGSRRLVYRLRDAPGAASNTVP